MHSCINSIIHSQIRTILTNIVTYLLRTVTHTPALFRSGYILARLVINSRCRVKTMNSLPLSALLFFSRRQVWYRRITRAFSSRPESSGSRERRCATTSCKFARESGFCFLSARKRALPSVDKRSQIGKRAISTRNPAKCREIISTLRYSLSLPLPVLPFLSI